VLIVDDDPIVLRIYKTGLARHGFQVDTAADGLLGVKSLHASKPDVVILDLMMPRLSGGDVLKFMRETPNLANTPVIVLTNSYLGTGSEDGTIQGAQAGLLKVKCTPAILIDTIQQVLEGGQSSGDQTQEATDSPTESMAPPTAGSKPVEPQAPEATEQAEESSGSLDSTGQPASDTEIITGLRTQFVASGGATCVGLRTAFHAFRFTTQPQDRELRLQDLYRRVHLLTSSAGLAECKRLAQMTTAFEALLFRIMDEPTRLTTSCLRTMEMAIDFIQALFREAHAGNLGDFVSGEVLIVDDDPVSNRLVGWGLSQAGLQSRSTEDPGKGLQLLREKQYDLILLDVQMPRMNGFEFCKRARTLPGYERTPVVFVTAHSDFETCAKSLASGVNDLIGKPVHAMELAVKVTMHLLSAQTPRKA